MTSPIGGPLNRRFSRANQTIPVRMKNPIVTLSARAFGGCTPMKKISTIEMIERTANSE
jgi:hypothetical protein